MQNSILVYSQAKVEIGIFDAVQSDRLAFMLEKAEGSMKYEIIPTIVGWDMKIESCTSLSVEKH